MYRWVTNKKGKFFFQLITFIQNFYSWKWSLPSLQCPPSTGHEGSLNCLSMKINWTSLGNFRLCYPTIFTTIKTLIEGLHYLWDEWCAFHIVEFKRLTETLWRHWSCTGGLRWHFTMTLSVGFSFILSSLSVSKYFLFKFVTV